MSRPSSWRFIFTRIVFQEPRVVPEYQNQARKYIDFIYRRQPTSAYFVPNTHPHGVYPGAAPRYIHTSIWPPRLARNATPHGEFEDKTTLYCDIPPTPSRQPTQIGTPNLNDYQGIVTNTQPPKAIYAPPPVELLAICVVHTVEYMGSIWWSTANIYSRPNLLE